MAHGLESRSARENKEREIHIAFLVIGLGLVARLCLAYFSANTFDMTSYLKVVEILRSGGNVYALTPYYNYSPLWSFWILGCSYVADSLGLSYPFIIRASLSVIDAINCLVILRISTRIAPFSLIPVMLYALNPAVILTVGYHGQFEVFAMLPILLAIDLNMRRPSQLRTWLLGTLAILVKQIVLFSVLTLFVYSFPSKRRSLVMMILSGIVFFFSFAPYLSAGDRIIRNVIGHTGDVGSFGLARQLPISLTLPLFLCLMTLLPFVSRYRFSFSVMEGLLVSSLAFVVLAPGFFPHYLIMPILVGVLVPSIWYGVFVLVSFNTVLLYLLGRGIPRTMIPDIWLVSTFYLTAVLLKARRPSRIHSASVGPVLSAPEPPRESDTSGSR